MLGNLTSTATSIISLLFYPNMPMHVTFIHLPPSSTAIQSSPASSAVSTVSLLLSLVPWRPASQVHAWCSLSNFLGIPAQTWQFSWERCLNPLVTLSLNPEAFKADSTCIPLVQDIINVPQSMFMAPSEERVPVPMAAVAPIRSSSSHFGTLEPGRIRL